MRLQLLGPRLREQHFEPDGQIDAALLLGEFVHGLTYRGFVSTCLNEQLLEGHTPFNYAVRNIALVRGPVCSRSLEDLYRERPYARVPSI